MLNGEHYIWTVINVISFYYFYASLGASDPFITFYSLQVPLYGALLLSIIVLVLIEPKGPGKALRHVLAFVIVAGITMLIHLPGIPAIVNKTGTELSRTIYLSTFIVPFLMGVLAPLTAFTGGQTSIFNRLFPVTNSYIKQNRKAIIQGCLIFLLIVILGNIVIHKKIIAFVIPNILLPISA